MPEAIWIRHGKVLTDCQRCVTKIDKTIPGIAKLHVTPYRVNDYGEYVCKARNENGFSNIVIKLVKKPSGILLIFILKFTKRN
jgi:hypothetical protein